MSNPVFDRLDTMTKDRTPNGYPTMPGYQPGTSHSASGAPAQYGAQMMTQPHLAQNAERIDMNQYEQMYAGPASTPVETGRLTYDDVLVKAGLLFALVLGGAAASWFTYTINPGMGSMLMMVGFIGGFITAMINIFKREPSPLLVVAYGVLEGLALGGISAVFNAAYPGVVLQALIASFVVFGVSLALFATGMVQNSPKLQMIALVGIVSILLLQLINWGLTAFNVVSGPWGLEGMTIMGIPVAGLLGIAVAILGAISFIGDFDQIKTAVQRQIPEKYSWTLAFGLMVTLVWLYVNLLRYAAILSGRD